MAIACVYCGHAHPSAAQVRECWQRAQSAPVADVGPRRGRSQDPGDHDEDVAAASRSGRSAGPTTWIAPGPPELARGLVVLTGGPVDPRWDGSAHVVIDAATLVDPEATVAALWTHAREQRRVVIELRVPFATPPRSVDTRAPFTLGPRFWFPLDVLHHLVWRNAVDATGDQPHWWAIDRAVALGGAPVTTAGGVAADGDIVGSNGEVLWLDAGSISRRTPIVGRRVLHAVALEHGSLEAPSDQPARAELADDQRAAVDHPGAAARIIAPAGSGKTRVLTERARHLLNEWRVPASALSLVAFNKRAQEEMQERTSDLRGLRVRTLNAIALAIVNGSAPFLPRSRSYRTIDEVEVRRIVGRLVQFPRKRNTDPVAAWIEALGVVRLGLRDPHDVEAMYNGDVDGLAAMWPRYRASLDQDGLVDFDEQVYLAIEVLLTEPTTRDAAQQACRLMLVDEFQDLTPAHVLLVRLLSAPGFGVFGVGDDDQTIYGYTGADPAWLIDFGSMFPDAGMHPLEVNYRCPADVVQAADRVVRHNRRRVGKVIRAARPGSTGLEVITDGDTLGATVSAVTAAVGAGHPPQDIAVLTRVNAMLAPVQAGLLAAGLPVRAGVGAEFLERTAVRAALAWIRLAAAPAEQLDPRDLAEALRRPSRPLHPHVAEWVAEQGSTAGLRRLAGRLNAGRDASRVATFVDDIDRLQQLAVSGSTADVLRALADDVGLGASIATLDDGRHGMNRAAQNDDLVALAQLASLHPDPATFGSWLRTQLSRPRSGDGVTLATVHRVKGQEWPVVVLHHAAADQYPHRLADDLEEERRVFHVAITRGSARVVVVAGHDPSLFVAEMYDEPPAAADLPVTTPDRRRPEVGGSRAAAGRERESAFPKGIVLAAPGLTLVDAGQAWLIDSVDPGPGGVVARLGAVTRRFAYGSRVTTPGRQRGTLQPPGAIGGGGRETPPSDASVRAHDLLRTLRERLRNGKPAYVVFDDKTLEAIALALPTSIAALSRIAGIGPAKLEQYGDAVLLAIEDGRDVAGAPTDPTGPADR